MGPLRRRRPVLRAAAVGGGAYALGKHRAAGDAETSEPEPRGAEPERQADAATAGGLSSAAVERLKELGQLHDQGVLTDDEFAQQKSKLLGG